MLRYHLPAPTLARLLPVGDDTEPYRLPPVHVVIGIADTSGDTVHDLDKIIKEAYDSPQ